ncbi:hypothetical protein [Thiogranum longum]|uniref:hypothetical protein n=1 Tax=Thiogranum longum TaxID=1537524 RepID=UPI00104F9EF7|nr:hypothetical protein [Thiogranum longum]
MALPPDQAVSGGHPAGNICGCFRSGRVGFLAGGDLPATRVPCASRRFARSLNSPSTLTRESLKQRSLNRKTPAMLGCVDAGKKANPPGTYFV